jgi:hypothetical protein
MPFKPEDLRKAAIALTLGGIAGAAIVQSHHDEAKKSRAEKDDPEGTEWICDIVWDLLDDWEPPDMECEDDYTDHLFRYLRRAIGNVLEEDDPDVSYSQMSKRSAGPTTVPVNKYPVFIISKGRWESRLTVKALENLGIPYHVVVEPQEYDNYAAAIKPAKILTLPFSNLGQGSIPARNWVWQFAEECGAKKHWILDDNMDGFYCLNNNEKVKVTDRNPFMEAEEISDRYENVAVSGLNYEFFAMRRAKVPPFYLNTRVYSCILINHALPYRWRGRYNEDTDLCIRALKDGWCTILMNYMLAKKLPTMTVKGGNTTELYKEDGRLKMAESLRDQHPDIVKITQKWNRWQHHVDYSGFKKNKLIPIAGGDHANAS